MALAKQKSALPTNKLMVGSAFTAIVGTQFSPAVAEVWPQMGTETVNQAAYDPQGDVIYLAADGIPAGQWYRDAGGSWRQK